MDYLGKKAQLIGEIQALQERIAELERAEAERKRAEEEIRQRTAQLEVLRQVGLEITTELDLDALLHSIVSRAIELMEGTAGGLYLYRPERDVLEWSVPIGPDLAPIGTVLRHGEGLAGKVWETGEPLIVDDYQHWEGLAAAWKGYPVTAVVGAPVRWGGEFLGVLNVHTDTPHAFSPADAELLSLFATQAAVAIQNAHLHAETQRRLQEQVALREAGATITSALNLETVLSRIAEQMGQAIDATSAYICSTELEARTTTVLTEYIGPHACAREQVSDLGVTYDEVNLEFLEALLAGQPHVDHVDDPDLPEYDREIMQQYGAQSVLYVPLYIRGEAIGYAELWESRRRREFTSEEITLCQVIAQNATIAVENARLFEEAHRRAEEVHLLFEATRNISTSLDLDKVLERIAAHLCWAAEATSGDILILDESGERATVRAQYWSPGSSLLERTPDIGTTYDLTHHPAILQALRENRPLVTHADDPNLEPATRNVMANFGGRSALRIPMHVTGVLRGYALIWDSQRRHEWTDEEVRLCQTLANQAAIAIENARLYEEIRHRLRQMNSLLELSRNVTSTLELGEVLHRVIEAAIAASGPAEKGTLHLLDEEREELVVRASVGFSPETVAAAHFKPGEGYTGWVFAHQQPVIIGDVKADSRTKPIDLPEVHEEKSALCAPLVVRDKTMGTLTLDNVTRHDAFAPEHLDLLIIFASQAAVAIENAQLYEETRQRAAEMGILYEVATAGMTSVHLDEILNRTMAALQETLRPDSMTILLVERETNELVIRAHTGFPGGPTLVRRPIGVGIPGWVVQTGQPVLLADVREDERYHACDPDTRSELCVPLWVGERVIGALNLESRRLAAFSEEDVRLLSILAGHLAAVIENARLFEEIEERRMYLEGVLGAAPDAIVTLDARHRIVEWNTGAERLFGYSREEVIGQDLDHLVTSPDVFDEVVGFTQIVLSGREVPPTETVRYRKDGSPVDVLLAASPILVGDELIGTVAVYTDITESKRAEDQLAYIATHDPLTAVPNRRGFFTLAEQQFKVADRMKRRMMLLFADFDHLKGINDALGHPEGDRALIEVADVLKETFRETDIIARIGGDEFVILAIETDEVSAEILTTRLQEGLEARNAEIDRRYKLSLSVGVAHYDPEAPCSIDELLARADRAMYERKRGDQKS